MDESYEISSESLNENNNFSIPRHIEKSSKRLYKQIYRKDWEEHPIFKEWLSSVPGDKYKAECVACNKELLAHRLTLLKHASSAKHLKKIALFKENTVSAKMELNDGNIGRNFKVNGNSASNTVSNDLSEVVDLNGVAVRSFSVHTGKSRLGNSDKEISAGGPQVSHINTNGATANTTGLTYENAVSNIPRNLISKKAYIESDVTGETVADNLGIIIRTESFVDISDSPEAINFKQGYTAKNSSSNKMNTNILSCDATFLSDKINDPGNHSVLNKITAYPLQVSTRVIDYSRGISVVNLSITLYKLTSGKWMCVSESITDEVGRCNLFPKNESFFTPGCYKLHYDVTAYYELQNLKSYFPFIEISFLIRFPSETHHIPLMISPNGYTTYRSLDF